MSIKKFIANKDTTITDAYKENLINRSINANMGAADSLEIFSIYGQAITSSVEKSRILIEFPTSEIIESRNTGKVPSSGSVRFFLRLYNVQHPFSVPREFSITINPLSSSWEEGYGLDMEGYTNNGAILGQGGTGATWLMSSNESTWDVQGGSYISGSEYDLGYNFKTGLEDLELDITDLTEKWISNELENNGLIIKLSSSFEDGTLQKSFYTKKFSARGSEYYMRRPCIEARWDPSVTDDRNNFFAFSNLVGPQDNRMNLYCYNKINNSLKNIYGDPILDVKFFTDKEYTNEITSSIVTVSNPQQGIYKAEVILDTTSSIVYDKWFNSLTTSIEYYNSSFDVYQREASESIDLPQYIVNIFNLKPSYKQNEQARFNIFIREKNWQPNIYTVAYNNIENTIIPNLYYKIFRYNDNYTIIDYSTGSLAYSKTSYDQNGNYFELDMNIFEKDYGYGIKLATWDGNQLVEFKDTYKFRVE